MFYSIVLLSDNYISPGNLLAGTGIYPSLLVDGSNEKKILAAYQYCSGKKTGTFSIAILLNASLPEINVQHIIAFLFLPGYLTYNNRITVSLIANDELLIADAKERLIACSYQQGIQNLAINHPVSHKKPAQHAEQPNQTDCFFTSREDLLLHYKLCLENLNSSNLFFYLYAPQDDPADLHASINALENQTKIKHPMEYQLANENQSLKKENQLLQKKYLSVADELNNYKLHLEMLRSSHQAKEIQDYYNEAYESLPLWYKRVGHLVKAVMGKRSFRSLFTDKVKKHKT